MKLETSYRNAIWAFLTGVPNYTLRKGTKLERDELYVWHRSHPAVQTRRRAVLSVHGFFQLSVEIERSKLWKRMECRTWNY